MSQDINSALHYFNMFSKIVMRIVCLNCVSFLTLFRFENKHLLSHFICIKCRSVN